MCNVSSDKKCVSYVLHVLPLIMRGVPFDIALLEFVVNLFPIIVFGFLMHLMCLP